MGRHWPLVVVLGLSPVYAQSPTAFTALSRVADPTFNTLGVAQDLEASGFTRDQAAGLTHALATASDRLASQVDINRLVDEVRVSHAELRARNAEQSQAIIMWLAGIALGIVGILVGIWRRPGGSAS